jgi:MSHA biogenesis protein MshJ
MISSSEQFWQRFLLLSRREKLMVVSAFLLIIWGIWDSLVYQPLLKNNQLLETDIVNLRNQINTDTEIAKQIEIQGKINPNATTREQLTLLQGSLSVLKEKLSMGEKKFVPSQLMANALSDILKQYSTLRLIKLETLPVSGFGNHDQEPAWLYRHTLEITLQGDYFGVLNYLKTLEALPWRIHWVSIDYQVKDYPIAETRLQVYTLSFDKDWLGV